MTRFEAGARPSGIVSAVLLVLLLAGCRQAVPPEVTPWPTPAPTATLPATATAIPARDPLNGTRWVLVSLHGQPPLAGTHITLEFYGGFMQGNGGCNQYNSRMQIGDGEVQGKYTATEDGTLELPGAFTRTLMASLTPEVNDQEHAYFKALGSAVAFRLVENHLELQDATGETVLVFTR